MAIKTARVAWFFKSELRSLADLKERLDPISPSPWVKFDSDSRTDFLASKLSPTAKVAIYDYGQAFVASIQVDAEESEFDAQVASAKQLLLSKLLRAIGAQELEEIKPPE